MVATSYDEIYERFLNKIHDYELLDEIGADLDFAKEIMFDFLRSAIPHFTYTDLDFEEIMDDENQGFTVELTSMEKEILARLMVVEYMSPKILKSDIFEERLGSKDFQSFSPANLLNELKGLRDDEESRTNTLMLQYYYMDGI